MSASAPRRGTSSLYRHSGRVPWASRLSVAAREKMFARFLEIARPGPDTTVLDVGVTSDEQHEESNFFERRYPYPDRIVCAGTEDGGHLERTYPGLRFVRVVAGQPLPFEDSQFDIAFSNAVVEHVGGRVQQRAFVVELCRVARQVFLTTPNRWFPVEHHTGLPLLHFLPRPMFRAALRWTPFTYWSHEAHLRILDARDVRGLFPPTKPARVERAGIGPRVCASNVIAYTDSRPSPDR